MPQDTKPDQETDKITNEPKRLNGDHSLFKVTPVVVPVRLRWILVSTGIFLAALLLVSLFYPFLSERLKFFTVNALSICVLAAIVVQAYIYRRQWEVMERQFAAFENQITQNEWQFRQTQRNAVDIQRQMRDQSEAMKGQLDAMKEQLTLMREQTGAIIAQAEASEISAKAAEISAVAAKQTAEVALKSFITAERPEIYFKRTQLYPLEAGKPLRAMFLACNGGRITAYKIAIEFNFCAPPRAILAFDNVLPWDNAVVDRVDIIPPEADITVRPIFGFLPTEVDLVALNNGTVSLYIYGRMRYQDGYGREYGSSFYRQYNPNEPVELMYAPESVKTRADHKAAEAQHRREQATSPDSET